MKNVLQLRPASIVFGDYEQKSIPKTIATTTTTGTSSIPAHNTTGETHSRTPRRRTRHCKGFGYPLQQKPGSCIRKREDGCQRIHKARDAVKSLRYSSTPTSERIAACERGQKIWRQKAELRRFAAGKISESSRRNEGEGSKFFREAANSKGAGERHCCATTAKGVK